MDSKSYVPPLKKDNEEAQETGSSYLSAVDRKKLQNIFFVFVHDSKLNDGVPVQKLVQVTKAMDSLVAVMNESSEKDKEAKKDKEEVAEKKEEEQDAKD